MDHIVEFRRRLMWVALVFVGGSSLAYTYHKQLLEIIMSPLQGQKLVYLTPGGGFSFIFQVSIYTGLILSAPFIVHHIYSFIRPALPERAQRSAGKVVLASFALITLGISYGYFVAVPAALYFLSGFAGDSVTPTLTADSYLSFFLSYIAGLAVLSLVPLLIIFWHWIKPMTPRGLLKSERWVILLAFIAAAVITPTPDAANQAMIAGPVILLYQFGIAAVLVSIARQKRLLRRSKKSIVETIDELPESVVNAVPALISVATTPTVSVVQSLAQDNAQVRPTAIAVSFADLPSPKPEPTAEQRKIAVIPVSSSTYATRPRPYAQAFQTQVPAARPARRSMDIISRPNMNTLQPAQRTASPQAHSLRTIGRSLSLDGFAPAQIA